MTPKEKAKNIFERFYSIRSNSISGLTAFFAKESSFILIDEILDVVAPPNFYSSNDSRYCHEYWIEVRKEIELIYNIYYPCKFKDGYEKNEG